MSGRDIEEFVQRSQRHGYEEHWVLSPDHGDRLDDDQLSLATRKTMSEHLEDRPTGTYCYAIHRDTKNPHVQVAVTGEKHDLWTEQPDLDRFRLRAREHTNERDYHHEIAREQQRERDQQQRRDRGPDRDQGWERG